LPIISHQKIKIDFRANFGDDSDSDEDNPTRTQNDEESKVYEPQPIGANSDDEEEDELDKFMAGIEVKRQLNNKVFPQVVFYSLLISQSNYCICNNIPIKFF
jgi:hypothetical protein